MDWSALQTRTNAAALAAFGQTVTLNSVAVQGDFQEPFDRVQFDGAAAAAAAPQVTMQSADVPQSPVGKSVVVGTVTYTVTEAMPDGHGLTTLLLEKAL